MNRTPERSGSQTPAPDQLNRRQTRMVANANGYSLVARDGTLHSFYG